MPAVTHPAHKKGDVFVDYEEKVFEDVKAKPGEKALVTFHTVAFEGSIGLVNLLQATRLLRKGFETSILLYGPGRYARRATRLPEDRRRSVSRPSELQQPDHQVHDEGGKVYACRFALQALYGHGEPSLIEGIRPINPLDVLDLVLHPPARQRLHSRHLDALSPPGGASPAGLTEGAMAEIEKSARRRCRSRPISTSGAATLEPGHRRHRRRRREGRRVHRVSRDLRALVSLFFLRAAAGAERRRAHPPLRTRDRRARTGDRTRVAAAARKAGMVVVLGINERDHGSLYNAQLVFDADGTLRLKRRKITPTFHERMIWGQGDGSGLTVVDTRRRARRRAGLLGALQSARPLRADGAARGNPRRAVSRLAGRPDLRRADRGDDPPPRAGERLLRRQRDGLADRGADRLDHAERGIATRLCAAAA